jgi:hypothetical protein
LLCSQHLWWWSLCNWSGIPGLLVHQRTVPKRLLWEKALSSCGVEDFNILSCPDLLATCPHDNLCIINYTILVYNEELVELIIITKSKYHSKTFIC